MKTLCAGFLLAASMFGADLTKIEIHVMTDSGRPIERASVIVRFVEGRSAVKFGVKIRKEWDLKASQEGIVKIPAIPQGKILIQVRADNYQTFGEVFEIREPEKLVEIKMKPPQPQYSAHDKEKP